MFSANKKKKSSGFTFVELLIVIFIIGILINMIIPKYNRCVRPNARVKSCYSNIRVLQGAIEMYNMDHMTMISTSFDLKPLEDENYLKKAEQFVSPNTSEVSCKYDIDGDMSSGGQVYCHYHGSVDPGIPRQAKN